MHLLRRRKRVPQSRGQALVEFALTIPIFLALLLGIIQFGLILWAQVTISQVARDAGRWAAAQPNCTNAAGVQTQVNTLASNAALYGSGPVTATTTWTPTPTVSSPCPAADNNASYWVNITVTHSIPMFLPGLPSSWTVSSQVQYRMEPLP